MKAELLPRGKKSKAWDFSLHPVGRKLLRKFFRQRRWEEIQRLGFSANGVGKKFYAKVVLPTPLGRNPTPWIYTTSRIVLCIASLFRLNFGKSFK
jgi:hypothetical protein